MSDQDQDELKKHVKDKDTWMRFVYLVVLGIAYYVTFALVFLTALVQFLAKLFSGSAFKNVASFGRDLTTYQSQLVLFLTFASDEKPFPFAPFPNPSIVSPPETREDKE